MPSRIITAVVTEGHNTDKAGGGFVTFGAVTSDSGPVSNARVTSATLDVSSFRSYSTAAYFDIYFGDSSGVWAGRTVALDGDDSTHSANIGLAYPQEALLTERPSAITLGVVATSGTDAKVNIRGGCTVTLTVNYEETTTPPGPPTSVSLSASNAAPGAKVPISWSGATAGAGNGIAGYRVHRATAAEGPYTVLATLWSYESAGSYTVTAPAANGETYYYKVNTLGLAGIDSALSSEYAALTCAFSSIGAPTTVKIDTTNLAPGAEATLSWSGASAGENNAIAKYEVYRADSANGEYSLVATVETSATSGSAAVTAPEENGGEYYFRVKAVGALSDYSSGLSSVYARLTTTFSDPAAPTTVTLDGAREVYAQPNTMVTLAWSGAAAGANNPVAGYTILRDGEPLVTGLTASTQRYSVEAHSDAGQAYTFAVVTVGEHSESPASDACTVYSRTDPTAPTTLTVSDATPAAGRRVLLSWSGAEHGGFNQIVGYLVYRATSADGTHTQVMRVTSSELSASCLVDAPPHVGGVYYFRVAAVGASSASEKSSVYAAITARGATEDDTEPTQIIVRPPKPRKKRGFIFDSYDTAAHGWTLAGWSFPEPDVVSNLVEVYGRIDGPIDYSTALTNGDPRFGTRPLAVSLEHSGGSRDARNAIISELVNTIHGHRVNIVFPDDPTRYATGRLVVETQYSTPAHAAIRISAVCSPWRYNRTETVMELLATDDQRQVALPNRGRKVLAPEVTVAGYNARVVLTCGDKTWTLTAGTYRLPDLILQPGNTLLTYEGTGTLGFRYREAIL